VAVLLVVAGEDCDVSMKHTRYLITMGYDAERAKRSELLVAENLDTPNRLVLERNTATRVFMQLY
jgi:hypothetical protein